MEYRVTQARRTAAAIIGFLLISGGILFLLSPLYNYAMHKLVAVAIIAGLLVAFGGLYLWLDTVKIKLVITDDAIELTHAFSYNTFLLSQIEGYYEQKSNIFLVLKESRKQFMIPQGLEQFDDIKRWIKEKYENADGIIVAQEKQEIFENENFGITEDERKRALYKAKICTRITNIAAGVIGIVFLFNPGPNETWWIIMLALPAVALCLVWYFKGLITFNARRASAYPTMVITIAASCFAVLIKTLEYDIYVYERLLNYLLAVTVCVCLLVCLVLFTRVQKKRNILRMLFFIMLFSTAYSYGGIVFANCYYDTSQPQEYRIPVIDKYIVRGKSTSYNITTPAWGRYKKQLNFNIGKKAYGKIQVGDTVTIKLFKGKLDIPWYYLEK